MKNVLKWLLLPIVIVLSITLYYNLNKKQKSWIKKEISFPSTLLKLDNNNFTSINQFLIDTKSKAKIVSIVDASCMKCVINNINIIDSVFQSVFEDNDSIEVVLLLNINSNDSALFMRNIYPKIKVKGNVLWDNNFRFEIENDILTDKKANRTFLLNNDNIITLVGSPLYYEGIIQEYIETVRNF